MWPLRVDMRGSGRKRVSKWEIRGNKYEIDPGSLEGKYKDWQKKLHPDLVHNKFLMKLNGINVNEEETMTGPTLLMEIMELREGIAEAEDSKSINQIRSQVQEKLKQWSDSFVEAFDKRRSRKSSN